MLTLTHALLRSLASAAESVSVEVPSASSEFVDVADMEVEVIWGVTIPKRLLHWIKSPVKGTAVRALVIPASDTEVSAYFKYASQGGGYSFLIKRSDKSAAYWSGVYRTLDEAEADAQIVLRTGLAPSQVSDILFDARMEFEKE